MKSAEAAAFPCVDQECPIERQLVKSNRGNISFAVLPWKNDITVKPQETSSNLSAN